MEQEVDLFASTSLFSSFGESLPEKTPNKNRKTTKENSSEGDAKAEEPMNGDDSDQNILEVNSVDQEELIVLDETGSSESEEEEAKENRVVNQCLTLVDDHDIQIIEKEDKVTIIAPITTITKPIEITLEDDVNEDKAESYDGSCSNNNCSHMIELSRLSKENSSLRQQVAQEPKYNTISNQELGVEIRFLKQSSARKYQKLFEDFIKTLQTDSNKGNTDDKPVQEVFSEFCIDKTATSDSSKSLPKSDVWKVPRYNHNVKETLKSDDIEVINESPKSNNAKPTCFNCLGDHMIANCTKAKDRKRIDENKKAYLSKCSSKVGSNKRYHADEDVRFSKYRPGVLSDELKQALGINKNEVPYFIYKMRTLGYPPGWMKEAEITSSGLALYDSEGKEVLEDTIEDGEVHDSSHIKVQHDPEKLISYPGFNVSLPYGVRDDHIKYGFPPMQDYHLKSNVHKFMKAPAPQPYKRKSSNHSPMNGKKRKLDDKGASKEDVDMEIEEINLEPEVIDESGNDSTFDNSLSLEELEQVKKNLLDVLSTQATSTVTSSDTNGEQSGDSQPVLEPEGSDDTSNSRNSDEGTPTLFKTPTNDRISDSLIRKTSISKSVELGSPSIIKSSPLSLPSRESFSVGITEHIPFENLPGTTGHFEKLRDVLKSLRDRDGRS